MLKQHIRKTSSKNDSPRQLRLNRDRLKILVEQTLPLLAPHLASLNLELATIESPLENGRQILRFIIDRTDPEQLQPGSSVTIEDCATISRFLGNTLEELYPSDGPEYILEVSSPGLDRPLIRERDFQRFSGSLAKLKIRENGRLVVYRGRLSTGEKPWRLLTDKGDVSFVHEDVAGARLIPEI